MGFGILIIIAVALTTSLGTYLWTQRASQPRICGGKFKAIGSKCYYIESDNEQVWLGALYQCSRLGGHLASIKSQQELDDISKELMPNKEYFIDISDQIYERDGFLSATTGLAPSFIHKNLDRSWHLRKMCAVINTLGYMTHGLCTSNLLFVCEKHEEATQEQKQKIEHFKKIGDKSYYIEHKEKRSWLDAFHRCQELGGHLATPRNDLEFYKISDELRSDSRYFIDLNDEINEGEFLSISLGSKDNFLDWEQLSGPKMEYGLDVVVIDKTGSSTYMTHAPSYETNFFICEALI